MLNPTLFLRRGLLLDAVVSGAVGLVMVVGGNFLSGFLETSCNATLCGRSDFVALCSLAYFPLDTANAAALESLDGCHHQRALGHCKFRLARGRLCFSQRFRLRLRDFSSCVRCRVCTTSSFRLEAF